MNQTKKVEFGMHVLLGRQKGARQVLRFRKKPQGDSQVITAERRREEGVNEMWKRRSTVALVTRLTRRQWMIGAGFRDMRSVRAGQGMKLCQVARIFFVANLILFGTAKSIF